MRRDCLYIQVKFKRMRDIFVGQTGEFSSRSFLCYARVDERLPSAVAPVPPPSHHNNRARSCAYIPGPYRAAATPPYELLVCLVQLRV